MQAGVCAGVSRWVQSPWFLLQYDTLFYRRLGLRLAPPLGCPLSASRPPAASLCLAACILSEAPARVWGQDGWLRIRYPGARRQPDQLHSSHVACVPNQLPSPLLRRSIRHGHGRGWPARWKAKAPHEGAARRLS